ncbi:MAG: DUF2127 domain-containing protein [Candidatus Bathyarchaeota archaeon]
MISTSSAPSAPAGPSAPVSPQRGSRPVGVTLLTVLEGIASFVMLLGGAALLILSTFLASGGWDLIPEEEFAEALAQMPWATTFTSIPIMAFTTAFLTGIGLVLLILAVLGFIMTWGLWAGKSWARTLTLILSAISIVTGIFSLPGSLISILINIAMLYYLTRPHIRAYYQ